MWTIRVAALLALLAVEASAASGDLILSLDDAAQMRPRNVTVAAVQYRGSAALEVRQTLPYRGPDVDTFAYVPGLDFYDGTIEVDVAGSVLPNAFADARGFVGIAFRIDEQDGSFACEGLYIRPTNGRAEDQVRRNHATQYFSYLDCDFARFRREAPERYEAYADMVPDEWIHLRIEVAGATARFYVGSATQPVPIVRDLKRGAYAHGTVGLFTGDGTDAHFRNLTVRSK